jgi:hypothetical protein
LLLSWHLTLCVYDKRTPILMRSRGILPSEVAERACSMSELKRLFLFNTGITGLGEKGKWDEDVHREQVMPVRGKIMEHDGMTGCYIGRYYIEVQFLDYVTNEETVAVVVKHAVDWAATQEGLFPKRGDKTPTAALDRPEPSVYDTVVVNFNSYILPYKTSKTHDYNSGVFKEETYPIAERLTEIDGMESFKIGHDGARIKFDTRYNNQQAVENHIRQVFEWAARQEQFFPFLGDKPLKLTFS